MGKEKIIYVKRYSVSWRPTEHTGTIHLFLTDGTSDHFQIDNSIDGLFMLDVLRNEKPIRYDKAHQLMFAHYEESGEHEE